jgi:hypothetical protein
MLVSPPSESTLRSRVAASLSDISSAVCASNGGRRSGPPHNLNCPLKLHTRRWSTAIGTVRGQVRLIAAEDAEDARRRRV